jgi:hypothetical protein
MAQSGMAPSRAPASVFHKKKKLKRKKARQKIKRTHAEDSNKHLPHDNASARQSARRGARH